MTEVKSLKDHKAKKKAKVIHQELTQVVHIMDLAIRALSKYSKYRGTLECMSVLKTNKDLFQIHIDKYEKLMDNKKND